MVRKHAQGAPESGQGPDDPLDGLDEGLATEVRRIWDEEVAGGRRTCEQTGSRRGQQEQRQIAKLLQDRGIARGSARWEAVVGHGRDLYCGLHVEEP